jgi:hypothetical protein
MQEESKKMVFDVQKRLTTAVTDLRELVVSTIYITNHSLGSIVQNVHLPPFHRCSLIIFLPPLPSFCISM